jgi:hypothetical protein
MEGHVLAAQQVPRVLAVRTAAVHKHNHSHARAAKEVWPNVVFNLVHKTASS